METRLLVVGLTLCCRLAWAEGAETSASGEPVRQPQVAAVVPTEAPPRAVAILELKASGVEEGVVQNLTDLLTAEAGKIPGFKVVSQAEIKEMIGFEMQKQSLGCEEAACFAQIGGALGVDLMVTGTFGKLGDTFTINLKLINIAKSETEDRLSETIAGRVDLLPDFMRTAAWRLFTKSVPAEVQARYDATKARVDEDIARARGDSAAMASAEQARAEAEKARAEAERAKAETEALKAQHREGAPRSLDAVGSTTATGARKDSAPAAGGGWQRIGKNVSTGVAVLGLAAAGGLHLLSFMKARSVGETSASDYHGELSVYDGTQRDADSAWTYRDWAVYGYAAGGVGVAAAIVFKILEPSPAQSTAWRMVPTPNGLAVEF